VLIKVHWMPPLNWAYPLITNILTGPIKLRISKDTTMASLFDKLRVLISHANKEKEFPITVEEAVDKILSDISEYKKVKIANMNEERLSVFHQDFGFYIMNTMRLWTNEPLRQSCCQVSGLSKVNVDQASYIILKELQNRLRQPDKVTS